MYGDDQYGLAALLSGIGQQPEEETAYSPQYQAMMQRFGGGAPAPQAPMMPQRPTLMARAGGGFEYGNAPVQQQQYPRMLGTAPRGYINEQQFPDLIPGLVRTLRGGMPGSSGWGMESVPGVFFNKHPQEQQNLSHEEIQANRMFPDIVSETRKGVPIIMNEDRKKQQELRSQFVADLARTNAMRDQNRYTPERTYHDLVGAFYAKNGRPPNPSEQKRLMSTASSIHAMNFSQGAEGAEDSNALLPEDIPINAENPTIMGSLKKIMEQQQITPHELSQRYREFVPGGAEKFGRQALESEVRPNPLSLGPTAPYDWYRYFTGRRPGVVEQIRRGLGSQDPDYYLRDALRQHLNQTQFQE